MRKIVFWIILPILMALMLSLTAGLALAELAPFHPGNSLFSLQYKAEQVLVTLTPNSTTQAETLLDMLVRRTIDLGSSSDRMEALTQFDLAFDQAMQALVNAPDAGSADLRTRSMAVLARVHDQLSLLAASGQAGSKSYQARLDRVESVLINLADLGQPLSALLTNSKGQPIIGLSAQSSSKSAADATRDPKAQPVDPHMVTFQNGSQGAEHDFFPLTGKHAQIACTDCHTNGQYAGLPTTCTACHSEVEPANHFPGECDLCHTTDAWKPAKFDHTLALAADCTTCHQPDKPANHWEGQCSLCHSTSAWKPSTFNHVTMKATDCLACHTQNRPANHWQGQCSQCHSTNAWKPATFNHAAAKATDCLSCHTKNRPANHWQGQCSQCHSTNAWKPATFNHAAAGATDCVSCHTKNRPANHWQGQCSMCHNTSNWNGTFNHAAMNATDCQSCHTRTARPITGRASVHNVTLPAPGNQPRSTMRLLALPTACRATAKTARPTTGKGSARCATPPLTGMVPLIMPP